MRYEDWITQDKFALYFKLRSNFDLKVEDGSRFGEQNLRTLLGLELGVKSKKELKTNDVW